MKAVAGLLLMFGVCHGVETYCDGRQDGAQCYGALGGTVDIQLMDSTSEIPRIQLLKNSLVILFVRNNKVISNTIKHRSLLFPSNGTFKINNLSRNDSGNYSFITFNSDGKASDEQTLHLFVQAPVSSALLVSECLSQGEMRVSCSSEGGDSPQYSWTLDGRTLTDAELLSVNNESNIITLRQHVSGRLVCSVRNSVSSVSKEERISTCGFILINCTSINGTQISGWVYEANNTLCNEPTTEPMTTQTAVGKRNGIVSVKPSTNIRPVNQNDISADPWYIRHLPLIGGVLSALVFFIVVGVAVICAQRKKQNNKPTKQKEDDQEVTYADVRVMKQQGKRVEQTAQAEAEVEYGQVKFSKRPRHTELRGDDCMYAKVHKVR
ncbi:uncharacterized protein LOC102076834 isoform X1 [Oreochromis niloticus]|uniref:uncharacterized protein LOC102076834 isoform X1 n=1 Tax=Oreochromis niloticus TaxID=8128 RepID=UPI000674480E|nr:uncharacterized protein LOC102076834 isoform X1 [Oreochromis niloticus]